MRDFLEAMIQKLKPLLLKGLIVRYGQKQQPGKA